ncbi:MAG: hypothetical protein J6S96_01275 [Muribaculaceae bacterium]|nr:hypothetical protein [Muribaculaceae bacterium]
MKAIKKYCFLLLLSALPILALAQESTPINLHFDQPILPESLLKPILPRPIAPGTLPTTTLNIPTGEITSWRSHTAQQAYMSLSPDHNQFYPDTRQPFQFRMNPYGHDWSSSGIITNVGNGYLSGSGSFTSFPALGNVASASVGLTQFLGDNITLTAGLSGNKYHMGRDAWNSYGVWGQASWKLSDVITLNAFGQYYRNQQFHSVAAMPFLQDTRYGGTMNIKMSEKFSLDVGAQRYYDVYTRQWRTVPIVAPTLTLMGQSISIDAGGLIYQILEYVFGSSRKNDSYNFTPNSNFPPPAPAGFNPNSPVRIPDALRR